MWTPAPPFCPQSCSQPHVKTVGLQGCSSGPSWDLRHKELAVTSTVCPDLLVATTFPPRSTVSWTFFRKSRSRQRLESLMVVAYVDSVMSRLGRHLSIQAALEQKPWWMVPTAAGLGVTKWTHPHSQPPSWTTLAWAPLNGPHQTSQAAKSGGGNKGWEVLAWTSCACSWTLEETL